MKQVFQLILFFFAISAVKAQTYSPPAFADVDNNYRTYVNQIFGALESNRVTTGLLVDYGFDFTDPKIYNGSVLVDSTLMEQGIYTELYKTIFTSKFNNNAGALRHPSIHDSLCYTARQKEVITLSGLLFKFNAIDPNAQANGKMQTVNGQLKDKYLGSVWQNPYQEFNTMAISPSTINYNLTYCSVVLPANLFLTNRSSEISTIQFDAADGQGYRTIQYNTPVNLNYADTGWKRWIFRITLTSGQQLYSHCKVHFSNTSNVAGSGGPTARGVPDRRRTIVATEQFDGAFGVADIVISYRDVNDQVLRRPLIVAEGFDPGWITNPEEPEGQNTFGRFIRDVRNSQSEDLRNLISGNPLVVGTPSAYDLVYVNWRKGTDWLQRNALVLEEVIREVNRLKQPDLITGLMNPNVVLGSSMGGVIARMALGRMDRGGGQNGAGGFAAHQTRLYVSLDAPHQGANVPLGYQAAARHATRMYISTGPIAATVEFVQFLVNGPSPLLNLLLADQPASRQMLNNRINLFYNPVNTTNQQFLNELRTQWAYPVNIRNIAISNGSECAIDQEFAAGSSLLYHYRSTKTRFMGDLLFMAAGAGLLASNLAPVIAVPLLIPGSNKFELTLDIKSIANGGGNAVYYGNVKLTKKVLWLLPVGINIANKTYTAPSGLLPLDTYPGGFYTLELDNQPGSVSQDWMFTYNNSFFIQRRFSFIPTTSALDIGRGNTALTNANYSARYVGATPPIAPFNTPFANFATAFNNGSITISGQNPSGQVVWEFISTGCEPHEGLYLRSANWLAAEMAILNPQPQFTNCNALCNNGSITGNTFFCNSETFTAPFGNGVNYTWSVDKPWLVTTNANANTYQITRNGNAAGSLTITVQITGDCGISTLTREVTMGYPMIYYNINPNSTGNECYTPNAFYYFNIEPGPNDHLFVSAHEWGYRPYNSTNETIVGDPNILNTTATIIFPSTGLYEVFVRPKNECGAGVESSTFVEVVSMCGGGGWFRITASPNPSRDDLYVTIDDEKQEVKNLSGDEDVNMALHDFYTKQIVRQWKFKNNQSQHKLSVRGLKKGMYILFVSKGKYQQLKQIIVE